MLSFEQMPKVELHYHLDGGVRPTTVLAIAAEEGIVLPTQDVSELTRLMEAPQPCHSLVDYLSRFELPLLCLQSAASLKRVAYEAVESAAADHVRYIEVRFAPLLHTARQLRAEEVVAAVLEGLRQGEKQFGIRARAILIGMRHHSPRLNESVIELAHLYMGKGVVGVDLAGDEAGYPPVLHRAVFEKAHQYGLPITLHAGEAAGPEHIEEAVFHLYARRIGHGVRLRENPQLLARVKEKGIALEMCVSSNVQTKAVASLEDHPIKSYDDYGLFVTVNTDNITVSSTTLSKEYALLCDRLAFTQADMKRLVLQAAQVSFLDAFEKQRLIEELEHEFARMGMP